jgi:hypothetical protein
VASNVNRSVTVAVAIVTPTEAASTRAHFRNGSPIATRLARNDPGALFQKCRVNPAAGLVLSVRALPSTHYAHDLGANSDRIFAVRAHYLNTAKIIEIAAITTATMAILSRYTQVVCGI